MNQEDIMNSIIVQGTILETDTKFYIDILENEGTIVEYNNPVERTIASLFRMCMDGKIDPWNIDLRSFTRIFSEIVDADFRDFGAAGFLIYEAWKILRQKSEISIEKRTVQEEDFIDDDQIFDSYGELAEPIELEIREPVRHKENRKVFLVELLSAMKEAYKHERSYSKKTHQINDVTVSFDEIVESLHAEEPDREIEKVYEHIMSYESQSLMLESVWKDLEIGPASFFVYCMFLAREKKIALEQESPFSNIVIRKIL